jgi:hypothetical protein
LQLPWSQTDFFNGIGQKQTLALYPAAQL